MKAYKVIKQFGSALKGDILNYEGNSGLFIMDIVGNTGGRMMAIDEETAEQFVNDGYLINLKEVEKDNSKTKLNEIANLITTLKTQYEKDHNDILDKYNDQELPTCVKVEADTVHFNLIKVLNKIESIINE